jgi:streptogramin lyase
MATRRLASTVAVLAALLAVSAYAATVSWDKKLRPTNTGIPGDYTHTIFVDENDRPWIAAYAPTWESGGMAHYDGDVWQVFSRDDYPSIITSPRFNDMVKDATGVMWIATDTGLLKYDPAVGPRSLKRYDASTAPLPTSAMRDLALSPDGWIWIALWHTPSGKGGLARFHPATGAWQTWTTATGLPWGAQWPNWNAIDNVAVVKDLDGGYTVWFESNALGVATYKNGVFQWFGVPSEIMSSPQTLPYAIESNAPADAAGNMWVMTNKGRARRNPSGGYTMVGTPAGFISAVATVYAMSGNRALATSFTGDVAIWNSGWQYLGDWGSGNHTYAFAEESSGAFWVGGIGGAARYQDGYFQRYRKTNTGMLSFFLEAIEFGPDGKVYFNANAGPGIGGFDIFDGQHWTCVNNFNYGLGPPWGLPADNVRAFCMRANGLLAHAPGAQGIYEWNGSQHAQIVPQGYDLTEIVEDSLGRLWASGSTGGGLIVTGSGPMATYAQIGATVPLIYGWIEDIAVDPSRDGWVWLASGLALLRTNGVETEVYSREQFGLTSGVSIVSVAGCPDGTVWFGAAGSGDAAGLHHLDPATGQFTVYLPGTTPLPSDDVHVIDVAPDGTIWVGTFDVTYPYPGGLTHYDGTAWTTYTTATSPLMHNQIEVLKSRKVAGGYELWVGTASEGVNVITVLTEKVGDIDGDGDVDQSDLGILLAAYGTCAGDAGFESAADIDRDGCVGQSDLGALLASYGT